MPEVDAFVVKDLDTVRPVVGNEDLLAVVDHHSVGELEVLGAAEFVQHVASLVEDDDSHNLAFDHDDPAFIVDRHASRVLQDIGTKFSHELPILVINLDLEQKEIEKIAFSKSSLFKVTVPDE